MDHDFQLKIILSWLTADFSEYLIFNDCSQIDNLRASDEVMNRRIRNHSQLEVWRAQGRYIKTIFAVLCCCNEFSE